MDLLRLPPLLRHTIIKQIPSLLYTIRAISTTTQPTPKTDLPPSTNTTPSRLIPTSESLNSYQVSLPPNLQQLKYASTFFQRSPPKILYSAAFFRSFPPTTFPEVAFLGRSNVGKSSLLNALFGRTKEKTAHVSKRPGRTKTMNGFGVAGGLEYGKVSKGEKESWRQFPRGGLVVVDMPGYGAGSRKAWGTEALKFLEGRKQLRRVFVLVDAEHGLKASDVTILTHLRQKGVGFQIVLSKIDKLVLDGSKVPSARKMEERLKKVEELCMKIGRRLDDEAEDGRTQMCDILCCSSEHSFQASGHRKIGVDEIRWAVLSACGMESDAAGQKRKMTLDGVKILDNGD